MSSPSVAESAADAHSQRAWKRWREIGSPRWVCAPMVDGSELAFRELVRRYSTDLCYTPMINAKIFVNDAEYRRSNFTTNAADRPLVAQFCADDPAVFVAGAKLLQDRVDAVDLNLGCPQGIARRGHYGSYLQDEWELIASIVRAASAQLDVPIWVKIRIFPCPDKSVRYAQMLEAAGASVIAVHGRTREQKGKFCMPADLDVIRAIKRAVTVPVIANGNVLSLNDAEAALEQTGADAVMSAFALLDNPANFFDPPGDALGPSRLQLSREYLALAEKHGTPMRMVKLHMFKLLRSRLDVNMDLNAMVGRCCSFADFHATLKVIEARSDADGISFEERVASGNTPRNVMAPKTVERMRKAAEAAAEAAAAVAGEKASGGGGTGIHAKVNARAAAGGGDGGDSGDGGGGESRAGNEGGAPTARAARRRQVASAGSAAYVDSTHFLVASGSVAHSSLVGQSGDSSATAAAVAAPLAATGSDAEAPPLQGRKRKAEAPVEC